MLKLLCRQLPTLLPALEYLGNAFEGSSMLLKDTRQRLPWSLGGFTERQVQRQVVKCRETWEGEHWGPGAADVSLSDGRRIERSG